MPRFAHMIKQLLHICKCHATSFSIAAATKTHIRPYRRKVKGHHSIIIRINLVDFESPMLCTKIQPQSFLRSGEEVFKCFTIYGHGIHLVHWRISI